MPMAAIVTKKLRSFFGAIEDWNIPEPWTRNPSFIAIVLRGDRGLEQQGICKHGYAVLNYIAIVLRGDRGLEQNSSQQ